MREFLLWSLPALLAGIAIRAVLMAQMPYAVYHDDTGDLLTTPHSLVEKGRWQIHGKKTFLVPTVYAVLVKLKIPLMLAVPVMQHFLGLVLIVMVGLLCRLWFARWKWFIVPITLLIAVNPALLWYEHLLMAETPYVFCTVLVAVAGTLYALEQNRWRFAFLCVALFLEAGARPEGKLLFGFAVFLLLLLHRGEWRAAWPRFAIMLAVAVGTHFLTRTGQAGLLLYASLVRMTPVELKSAPGFDPYIGSLRADLQKRWDADLSFPRVAERRAVEAIVGQYMADRGINEDPSHEEINEFCMKLAKETAFRNFFRLPAYFYQKFRNTTREPTFGYLDENWLFKRQQSAFVGNGKITRVLAKEITGEAIRSPAEYAAFLGRHYRPIGWFNTLANTWNDAVYAIRFPDEIRKVDGRPVIIRRLPVFYVIAAAGLLLVMFRRGRLQPFHIAWGLSLVALLYVIVLTANIRGRFRFGLEPFWYLYIGLLLDTLAYWVWWKQREPAAPAPSAAAADPVRL